MSALLRWQCSVRRWCWLLPLDFRQHSVWNSGIHMWQMREKLSK
jgi:hypothetical protein